MGAVETDRRVEAGRGAPLRAWTRIEDYLEALARRRTARRKRYGVPQPRTEPESPRVLLSTLPFLALMAGLGILAAAIIMAAWPGRSGRRPAPVGQEQGTAAPGWFEEAKKDMRTR